MFGIAPRTMLSPDKHRPGEPIGVMAADMTHLKV